VRVLPEFGVLILRPQPVGLDYAAARGRVLGLDHINFIGNPPGGKSSFGHWLSGRLQGQIRF